MHPEKNYEFRWRLDDVHASGRRDRQALHHPGECVVDERWKIVCSEDTLAIAQDLQDYFARSMELLLPLSGRAGGEREIRLRVSGRGCLDST